MKYLRSFNQKMRELRHKKKLTTEDIAVFCMVDESAVRSWEAVGDVQRSFPTIDQLLDLCVKTNVPLELLLDLDQRPPASPQLDLLGYPENSAEDLSTVLTELGDALESALPDERERELLRRFRHCDDEKRSFIMQLLPKVE